jgi:thiamine-phosphate pyrophosphorylase
MTRIADWDVYLVTDRAFSKGRSNREIVQAAVRGGVSAVQLREKELSTRAFLNEGLEIREMLRSAGIPLIVNDRLDIALALDADGIHIGRDDMPIDAARRILGPDRIIGLSVNTPDDITGPDAALADYLAVSPVFHTSTKNDITVPWGLEGLSAARALTDTHLMAIGSIKLDNARKVTAAGADSVAVVTAIVGTEDPAEATSALVNQVRLGKSARKRA